MNKIYNTLKTKNWKRYGFEFFSIFIAVVSAFALNNWNENRRDSHSENKILTEIANGLEKDLEDIKVNMEGHNSGILAGNYFRQLFAGKTLPTDSIIIHYFNLSRDFISIQNIAGYETLKSKGLELVKNDSLRLEIISLYEYDYNILRKFEEEYTEMQFHQNYFKDINKAIAPYFTTNTEGILTGINAPLNLPDDKKKELLLYLWKIQSNRVFILHYYTEIEKKVTLLKKHIDRELNG